MLQTLEDFVIYIKCMSHATKRVNVLKKKGVLANLLCDIGGGFGYEK